MFYVNPLSNIEVPSFLCFGVGVFHKFVRRGFKLNDKTLSRTCLVYVKTNALKKNTKI